MLAQYPPSPSETPLVPVDTAVTGVGTNFDMLVITLAVLVVVGLVALFVARKRRA